MQFSKWVVVTGTWEEDVKANIEDNENPIMKLLWCAFNFVTSNIYDLICSFNHSEVG